MAKLMRVFMSVSVFLAFGSISQAEVKKNNDKIGSLLQEKLEKYSKTSDREIMVYLGIKASFTKAKMQKSRKAKLKSVYEASRDVAKTSQASLVKYLKSNNFKFQQFYITNMIVVKNASKELVHALSLRSDVSRILDNPIFKKEKTVKSAVAVAPQENLGVGPNLIATGAERVWNEFNVRGENIVVAGQDTGIQWNHPALKFNYRGTQGTRTQHNYSWHDAIREPIGRGGNSCGYDLDTPCDDNAHGTHTIGTVVGNDQNGNIIGMAPNAKWIGCRNMDAGNGRPSTYIECFEYFLAPYPYGGNPLTDGNPEMAPHVINNSWGCPSSEMCEGDEFMEIMEALGSAGIMVVASAGNDGSSCASISTGPAHHSDSTFSVGASNHRNDRIANFSSRGPSGFDGKIGPDVTAPGVSIYSSIPGDRYDGNGWSGTSMAGPHVVGQVALIWSAVPSLIGNIEATSEIIRSTARPQTSRQSCAGTAGSEIPNNTFGHGIIDAYAAVQKAIELYGQE